MTYEEAEVIVRAIFCKKGGAVSEWDREILTIHFAGALESAYHRGHSAGVDRGIEIANIARGGQ